MMATSPSPTLLDIETAVPPLALFQEELFEACFRDLYAQVPEAAAIFKASGVRKRHAVLDPRQALSNGPLLTGDRMAYWERLALDLSRRSVGGILDRCEKFKVGSFIVASCTGYAGPTLDLRLAQEFHLDPGIRRTFVGHMGCHAAFNALKLALDSLVARPHELVLLTCTETCSLHVRHEPTKEQVVVQALFADASASFLLGNAEPGAGPRFIRTHTHVLYEFMEAMTWRITNDGFRMTLSPLVPLVLAEGIERFVHDLLAPVGLRHRDVTYWGVHPGGPKILNQIVAKLGLTDAQARASRAVLSEYGNCSSATVLLILNDILEHERPAAGEYGVFMAFGPGLTMESLLMQF
jgi:predicted naringenin-chalcone synthase